MSAENIAGLVIAADERGERPGLEHESAGAVVDGCHRPGPLSRAAADAAGGPPALATTMPLRTVGVWLRFTGPPHDAWKATLGTVVAARNDATSPAR